MKCPGKILLALLITTVFACCNQKNSLATKPEIPTQIHTSIYHWKTTFDIDSIETLFLQEHKIDRIYLRMFDVAVEQNYTTGKADIVPIATTKFTSTIPSDIEIVPVTYITIDALRAMSGKESEFASLIVERLLAMCSYNNCGKISEIQLDCDWTASTKSSYINLCQSIKDSLQEKDIQLSITVRLHQLQETPPPTHRGVLMLYNTGALKNPDTRNSILDINDAKPYLKKTQYPIPLGYAYPTFGWGVKFKNNKFHTIVASSDTASSSDEHIRYERPTPAEIIAVKNLVELNLGKPASGNIIYHFDYSQLKNYTTDEINQILSY